MVTLYTDGACRGNPGPGGYAAILLYPGHRQELCGGFVRTTNNRMELLAVIVGLEAIPERAQVMVYTDSRYVAHAVNLGWLARWLRQGLHKKKNADLWRRFWQVYQRHEVTMRWIQGHAGHVENERCDRLAVQAARDCPTAHDQGYELGGDGLSR